MTESLLIALFAVAAVAAWAWVRRKHDEELTGNESPPNVADSSVPSAGVPPDAPLPNTPQSSEAVVKEVEQTTPPPPVATPTPETPQELPNRPRVTSIGKPAATWQTAPEHRGGGQMEAEGTPPAVVEQHKHIRSGPQLRLVCFKDPDRMWRVAVELPEDFSARCDIKVVHDGHQLEPVRFGENRWPLHRLNGNVEAAEVGNGRQRWQLEIVSDECLLFKLLEDCETEEGRLVSTANRGEYLAIAPQDWPVPESSGIRPSRERNVGIPGHVGYRFIVREGVLPRLEFGRRGFQREKVQFRTACFELVGERANAEFSEYQSPVFLKSPPSVRSSDMESWSRVQKVVLGVAGRGHNKWKNGFKPNSTNNEIQLSEHLNGRTGGWYFVRLYDENEVLIDSLYFAFAIMLRSIKISGVSALPAANGHAKARLEFEHDKSASIEVYGEHEPLQFDAGTAFVVPPRCDCERVDWQLIWPGQPPLKCTTRIERIWWALGSKSAPPTDADWTDKPVTGKRAHFFAASDKVLFIRLPCTSSISGFGAGFTRVAARRYAAVADECCVPIPLRDFAASDQVHAVGIASFGIWVSQKGQEGFAEALRLEIVYECCLCSKRFRTDTEALTHAVEHEKVFIRELTYDELRRLDPDLPPAIYQCLHPNCGWYVCARPLGYPTDAIIHHITDKHGNPHEPTPISYRIVADLDEIRRNIERHLPQIFRCKCGKKFENVGAEDFSEHIFHKHRNQLFNLV